ncbi:MAG: hypothetical protein C4584_01335 [Armatimonadetes bacterium]|nr:MAG: hypothetical protein C4584_01335 [Armatimonadota bacterium]
MIVKNFAILKYILPLFFGWWTSLLFITYLGLSFFPSTDPIHQKLFFPSPNLEYWIRWANWDGGHYRGIAENGYLPIQTVFFPFYPILIKLLMFLGLSSLWSSLLISQASTLITLFFFYKLVLLDHSKVLAKRAVFVLLIFPTSFYLVASYSESLFLALTITAFYFARTKKWAWAFLLAGLATITRMVGIVTILAILFEILIKDLPNFSLHYLWRTLLRRLFLYNLSLCLLLNLIISYLITSSYWLLAGIILSLSNMLSILLAGLALLSILEWFLLHLNFKPLLFTKLIYPLLSFLPLLLYLLYQRVAFGNPLLFLNQEQAWNKSLSLPWHGPLIYWQSFQITGLQIGDSSRVLLELLLFSGLLVGLIISLYKLKPLYSFFYLLALLIPLLSGTLLDLPRYTLAIFPLFILLGMIKEKLIQKIGTIFSLLLSAALAILYINSYWFM